MAILKGSAETVCRFELAAFPSFSLIETVPASSANVSLSSLHGEHSVAKRCPYLDTPPQSLLMSSYA